ncbi:peptidoglycan-binding protein LysM [Bacillus sp. M6-12]|uniref:LysM peptidoglycan-binding domain-containing protein n=1 Tax=Bacillus sp. M6-12 TaxID=2054166 RepID=UPI000C791EAB|nr:LysM peptidoglycan-binding domain-containing protein [Bacillus sp. M6-12]PLS16381.1 peptidoglycan-binding protein LysM [Bacillus sp. M6-12]
MESERRIMDDQAGGLRSEMKVSRTSRSSKLPTRSEVHRDKRKKNKWKIKFPMLKLLSLFFILLPITIYSLYSYFDQKQDAGRNGESSGGYETINIGGSSEGSGHIPAQAETPPETETSTSIQNESYAKDDLAGEPKAPAPAAAAKPADEQGKQQNESDPPGYKVLYHTVQPQETIFRISMKYYKSQDGIPLIREWNSLQANEIEVGQVLKIPIKQ